MLSWIFVLALIPNVLATAVYDSQPRHRVVYQFSRPTWLENIYQTSDGSALFVTSLLDASIYTLNPSEDPVRPSLLHSFNDTHSAVLGITEVQPQKYYVVAGNLKLATGDLGLGSYEIMEMDMTRTPLQAKKVASLPDAGLLNGLVTLSVEKNLILAADYSKGVLTGSRRLFLVWHTISD